MKTQFKIMLVLAVLSLVMFPTFGNAKDTIKVGIVHSITSSFAIGSTLTCAGMVFEKTLDIQRE